MAPVNMPDITTLYKRSSNNQILFWSIRKSTYRDSIFIIRGILKKHSSIDVIPASTKNVSKEITSRINAKQKEGYKLLSEVFDNAPDEIDDIDVLWDYLNTHLPKFNTSDTGVKLPMLAKTLEDCKPFKDRALVGQYKINGIRCLVGAIRNNGDMFNPIKLTYHSRTGTEWDLSFMDEFILPVLSAQVLEVLIEEEGYLDGELYLPGYQVNDINSFVKNKDLPQHYQIQYWIYDLAVPNYDASFRKSLLNTEFGKYKIIPSVFNSKEDHLNNTNRIVLLSDHTVKNYGEAINTRDSFIDLGFEGLILRDPRVEYAFGKRIQTMWKFKKKLDGKFIIVSISKDKRGLPIFTCKNDINDYTFECTLNDTQDKQIYYAGLVKLNETCMFVEYRERSGVKEVPFHAKGIFICI